MDNIPSYNEENIISSVKLLEEIELNNENSPKEKEIDLENNQVQNLSIFSDSDYFKEDSQSKIPNFNNININHTLSFNSINTFFNNKKIYFITKNQKIKTNFNFIIKNCPSIIKILNNYKSNNYNKNIKNNEILIELPNEITKENIFYFHKFIEKTLNFNQNNNTNENAFIILNILLVSLYFENNIVKNSLLSTEIPKILNLKNSLFFYKFSLNQLNKKTKNNNNEIWNYIISLCIKIYSENLLILKNDEKFNKEIRRSEKKLIFDLYCQKNKLNIKDDLINYFCESLGFNEENILLLLNDLYNEQFEINNISNFLNNLMPTIINLNKDKNYDNFEVKFNSYSTIFEILCEKREEKFRINFKVKDFFCFIFNIVYFDDEKPILNFSKNSNFSIPIKEKENVLYVYFKIDFLFTVLFNFFLNNPIKYINAFNKIKKPHKNFIKEIFVNFKNSHINNNISLISFINYYENYLGKQNNLVNINEIIQTINLREVNLDILSEFYIKFYNNKDINQDNLNFINKILKENNLDKIINHCAKKINFEIKTKKINHLLNNISIENKNNFSILPSKNINIIHKNNIKRNYIEKLIDDYDNVKHEKFKSFKYNNNNTNYKRSNTNATERNESNSPSFYNKFTTKSTLPKSNSLKKNSQLNNINNLNKIRNQSNFGTMINKNKK